MTFQMHVGLQPSIFKLYCNILACSFHKQGSNRADGNLPGKKELIL
jgi:hypothetical protein